MFNPFTLENKRILVTGASSGIGRATAIVLSKMGASLVLVGRDTAKLVETRDLLEFKERHLIEPFDLQQVDEIAPWLNNMIGKLGSPFDGFTHAAGIHKVTPIRTITNKLFEEVMMMNLNSGVQILKACSNKSIAKHGSSFVFISSASGIVGEAGLLAYSASKGAIISMVKSAAIELAPKKTRVNCIVPSIVETNMTERIKDQIGFESFNSVISKHPLGIGQPEDVAYAVAYLLSDASKWVTGTALVVDGGYSC